MEHRMRKYFESEKKAVLLLSFVGFIMLCLGLWLYLKAESPRWQGMGIPLFAIAIPQLLIGGSIYFRTDRQVNRLIQLLAEQPKEYISQEIARMERVNKSFRIYIGISLSLFIIGISLLISGVIGQLRPFLMGFGGGLALQAAIMMIFDLFAEMRAALYTSSIVRFKQHPDRPF